MYNSVVKTNLFGSYKITKSASRGNLENNFLISSMFKKIPWWTNNYSKPK